MNVKIKILRCRYEHGGNNRCKNNKISQCCMFLNRLNR